MLGREHKATQKARSYSVLSTECSPRRQLINGARINTDSRLLPTGVAAQRRPTVMTSRQLQRTERDALEHSKLLSLQHSSEQPEKASANLGCCGRSVMRPTTGAPHRAAASNQRSCNNSQQKTRLQLRIPGVSRRWNASMGRQAQRYSSRRSRLK